MVKESDCSLYLVDVYHAMWTSLQITLSSFVVPSDAANEILLYCVFAAVQNTKAIELY